MGGEKPARNIRAVIYARISMDREGAGLGVERQSADCRKLIADRGWQLTEAYYDNDISAYSGRLRPSYRRMLGAVAAGQVDAVIAWHTDRLHRSPRELEEWIEICERNGVATVTVRAGELDLATAAGRMVARMLGAAARHESEQKSERVSRARQQAAEAGLAHGPLGYGFNVDQTINVDQAEIIREVAARIMAGETLYSVASDLNGRAVPIPGAGKWTWRTLRRVASDDLLGMRVAGAVRSEIVQRLGDGEAPGRIASDLTRRGVVAPTGGWRSANLRQMIIRGSLCGYREWEPGGRGHGKGELVAHGTWTAIISRQETERLRELLNAPGRDSGRAVKHLLSGVLACGRCGARMGGRTDSRSGKRNYSCSAQPGMDRCGKVAVRAEPVEALIEASVLDVLSRSAIGEHRTHVAGNESDLRKELDAARETRDLLVAQLARGELSTREWATARPLLDSRIKQAQEELGATSNAAGTLATVPSGKRVHQWWKDASVARRRAVIVALIERVEVAPGVKGRNWFDPTRIAPPVWRA